MSERLSGLLEYADRLTRLNEHGYNCYGEIDECIQEIRRELDISNYDLKGFGLPATVEMDAATKQHLDFLKNNPPIQAEDEKKS